VDATLKGKIAYLSPEQARGEPLDGRSDLFGLGIVLYEMLAARHPFIRSEPLLTLSAIEHAEWARLANTSPELAPADAVLEKLLARSPEDRFPSGAAASEALAALRSSFPAPPMRLGPFVSSLFGKELDELDQQHGASQATLPSHRPAAPPRSSAPRSAAARLRRRAPPRCSAPRSAVRLRRRAPPRSSARRAPLRAGRDRDVRPAGNARRRARGGEGARGAERGPRSGRGCRSGPCPSPAASDTAVLAPSSRRCAGRSGARRRSPWRPCSPSRASASARWSRSRAAAQASIRVGRAGSA
jgi:serine/threonine-protein kinase